MRVIFLYLVLAVLLAVPFACAVPDTASSEIPLFPAQCPDLVAPPDFDLSGFYRSLSDTVYNVTGDIDGWLFEDCDVHICGDGLSISGSRFVNTRVFVGESRDVTFEKSIFEGLARYEETALSINESDNISVTGCIFRHNYIGLGIHASNAAISMTRFEFNNGHNALVIGEGSSAVVSGCYFYGSFPHAVFVMNREGESSAQVDINNNIIMATGEDAIDFEDYRKASLSVVSRNVIVDTGWSAVIVEYNSWNSGIFITDNWIVNTGIDWSLPVHDLQPEPFQPGWGHGIFIEDSSGVVIERNRIVAAGENGIEVRNGRNVRVTGNGIDCAGVAVAAHDCHESSLSRSFSPLLPGEAGGSEVTAAGNVIYTASRHYEVDKSSALLVE